MPAWEKQTYMGVKMGYDWLSENCGLQGYVGQFPALFRNAGCVR